MSFPPRKVRLLRKHGARLIEISEKALAEGRPEAKDHRGKVERRVGRLTKALGAEPDKVEAKVLDHMVRKLEKALVVNGLWRPKSFGREMTEALIVAGVIAAIVRSFITEPFKIPTGSMIPTLQIEDFIFVTKYAYGLRIPFTHTHILDISRPNRGDVIVFDFPREGEDYGKNFIKRVVAVPGDTIRMTDNRLHINDQAVPTRKLAEGVRCQDGAGGFTSCACDVHEEQLGGARYQTQHHSEGNRSPLCMNAPNWPLERPEPRAPVYFGNSKKNPNWPLVEIPPEHFLVMGDNRVISHVGRYWGLVHFEVVKGRAWIIWWARDKSRVFTAVHQRERDGDIAHAATKRTDPPGL